MTKHTPIAVLIVTHDHADHKQHEVSIKHARSHKVSELHARAIDHAIDAYQPYADHMIVVYQSDELERTQLREGVTVLKGGLTRAQSVQAGLNALQGMGIAYVLVHDAQHAFISAPVIENVLISLRFHNGSVPAVTAKNTLWRGASHLDENGHRHLHEPQSPTGVYDLQTPQGFDYLTLLKAYNAFESDMTDTVSIARAAGIGIAITAGCETNIKIAYPETLELTDDLREPSTLNAVLACDTPTRFMKGATS